MATGQLGKVIRQLQAAFGHGPEDARLLECFLARRDEEAFAELVRRHGPMVLGVCRRVLRNEADAEDAFQATFLVLACKAATVRKRGALANFLYGVAQRTALEARRAAARRRAKEARVMHRPAAQEASADLREALDEELAGLPEKYRAALVLCDLEGKGRKAAAAELGVAEGTVASRVARGRSLLARRLARRGLALSMGALAAMASEAAAVPAPLVLSTARAAVLVAAGQAAGVSASAAVLMKGVLKTMFLAKLKMVVATVMVVTALGAGGLVYRTAVAGPPAEAKAPLDPEALRKENELLKINLEVVLEKVRAQAEEIKSLKAQASAKANGNAYAANALIFGASNLPADATWLRYNINTVQPNTAWFADIYQTNPTQFVFPNYTPYINLDFGFPLQAKPTPKPTPPDPAVEAETALKALREARDKEAKRRAADALDKAVKKLRDELKK
jgi:RNA polymerase sigma factor (sigma-70 family)